DEVADDVDLPQGELELRGHAHRYSSRRPRADLDALLHDRLGHIEGHDDLLLPRLLFHALAAVLAELHAAQNRVEPDAIRQAELAAVAEVHPEGLHRAAGQALARCSALLRRLAQFAKPASAVLSGQRRNAPPAGDTPDCITPIVLDLLGAES